MGNSDLKPAIIHSTQWILLKQINHPYFGPIKIFKNVQEKLKCLRTFTLSENEVNSFLDYINSIKCDQYRLISINKIEQEEESQFCSNFHKIHLTLDYTEKQLEKKEEVQMKQFAINLIESLQYLEKIHIDTCQLCLSKLLLFGNTVKLIETQLLTQTTDYSRICYGDLKCDDWYFSPEVMKCLRNNDNQTFSNEKSTIFNFGLILITLYIGQNPKEGQIYNYEKCCLTENFSKYINQLKDINLDDKLTQIILKCVSLVPDKRPSYQELLELFQQVDFEEKTVCNESPQKNESQYHVPTNQLVSFNPNIIDDRVLSEQRKSDSNRLLIKTIVEQKHQNTPQCQSPKFRQETMQSNQTVGTLKSTKIYNLENLKQSKQTNNKNKNQRKNDIKYV